MPHRIASLFTVAAILASLLSACAGISRSERTDLGSATTATQVDFVDLYAFAERSHAAYASEAQIRSQYPKVTRVASPGGTDVLYFLEQDDKAKVQYIAVRGTANKKNFHEDIAARVRQDTQTAIPVHTGFDATAQAIFNDVKPYLKPDYKTYVTGHSLGGAVAAVLAIYIIEDGHDVQRVVTFGQPQFTTAAGVEQLSVLPIVRVVDENDLVPMLPPATDFDRRFGPYEHVGPEIILLEGTRYVYLPAHDANRLSVGEFWRDLKIADLNDHKMTNYLGRIEGKAKGAEEVPYNVREQYVAGKPSKT